MVITSVIMAYIGYGIDNSINFSHGISWAILLGTGTWTIGSIYSYFIEFEGYVDNSGIFAKTIFTIIFDIIPFLFFVAAAASLLGFLD